MRQFFIAFLLLCIAQTLYAQIPQSFNYQAIARNADHLPLGNADISVEVNILRNGATIYTETDDLTTAPTGLFSIAVGSSNPADFQAIDWRLGGYELQVRLSGALDLVTPATPIIAVPFALMAEEVLNEKQQLVLNGNQLSISGGNTVTLNTNSGGVTTLEDLSDVSTTGVTSGQVLQWNGSAWVPATVSTGGTLTAGPGIQISANQVNNTGDINANDDITVTTQSGGDVSGVFADLQIKNGAVGGAELADGAVTAPKLGPMGAGSGQVLKWNGSAWAPADVTVSANSITSTQITDNSITINDLAPGLIPTTLPPSGVAGGDLNGAYPNPTVDGLQGNPVASTMPVSGQVLKWNGSTWLPQNDIGGGNGDDWGTQFVKTDATLAGDGTATNTLKIAQQNATNGQYLKWNGSTWAPADVTVSTNSITSNQITDNSITINDLAPGVIPTSLPPSGVAGGDLSGTYPGPVVAKIQGKAVASTAPTDGQVLKWDASTSQWKPNADDTGPAGTTYAAGAGILIDGQNQIINSGDLDPADDLTLGTVFSGDVTGTYNNLQIAANAVGEVEIADGSVTAADLAPGVIPASLPPSGAATGDLSGNYPGPMVAKIQGKTVASTAPVDGQVLQYNGASQQWEPVTQNSGGGGWSLSGNSGTNPNISFIGTTDVQPVVFRVNNVVRMKLHKEGRLELFADDVSNAIVGHDAGRVNTGYFVTAFGSNALYNNTGIRNTAIGYSALRNNIAGIENTAVGAIALSDHKAGDYNTAIGAGALEYDSTGYANTAIGSATLLENKTGANNTATGASALRYNSTGTFNTATGVGTLQNNLTGSSNTAYGSLTLSENLTGNNNTALGSRAGPDIGFNNLSNTTALGYSTKVSASNTIAIGNNVITSIKGQVNFTTYSDARIKTNIQENIPGLAFIQKLRPVSYHYDTHRQNSLMGITDTAMWDGKYDIENMSFSGFLAQEVEEAAKSLNYDFSGVDAPTNEHSLYGLRYAEFTVPLVKAVQEQQTLIEAQKAELTDLKSQLATLQQQVQALVNQSNPTQPELKTESPK